MRKNIPDRGDIWEIDFEPQKGKEQMKRRPALILSPAAYNKYGIAILCPISARQKQNETEVPIDNGNRIVQAGQPKSFDWKARNAKYIERADTFVLQDTQDILQALICD